MTITGWMWFRYFTGSHLYFCEFLYGFGSFGSAAAMDSKVMQCKAMASSSWCGLINYLLDYVYQSELSASNKIFCV